MVEGGPLRDYYISSIQNTGESSLLEDPPSTILSHVGPGLPPILGCPMRKKSVLTRAQSLSHFIRLEKLI